MHKNLHKDLYSKRNKKKNYPPVNNISITPTDNIDNETVENVLVASKKKYNRLAIFTTLIASGIIIFSYSFFSSSSQNEINLISVDQNDKISEIGGKNLFCKEIEESLLKKEIDIAVHSLKDMEANENENLLIGAYVKRNDYRDVIILSLIHI